MNALNWINFLWKNLLPVTIGNIIGGAVFVGMSYWGAYLRPVKDQNPDSSTQRRNRYRQDRRF